MLLDFLNWTHGNRVQPDSFINHKSLATSAKNQGKNESTKYSIANMNIAFNLDLVSGLIASLSPMMLVWGDWVSPLPDSTFVVLTESLYKQCHPQSGNKILGGETIKWGRRNCSLYSLTWQSEKKNHPCWCSCLLVPTRRALTCFWLCGYMLHVKVYCSSVPCLVIDLPLQMDPCKEGEACLVSPHPSLRCWVWDSSPSQAAQRQSSLSHPLPQWAGHLCRHSLGEEQSQEVCRSLLLIYLYLFIPFSAFTSADMCLHRMCLSRVVIWLPQCQ